MTYRTFSRKKAGLSRDADGRRTGFKVLLRIRLPMSEDGFRRWGLRQRTFISRYRYVWRLYGSSAGFRLPDGIPITYMRNNQVLGEWLINNFFLQSGETYSLHGWTGAKTPTHCKLTKALAFIEIQDAENLKFVIKKDGRLNRYWFREKPRDRLFRRRVEQQ